MGFRTLSGLIFWSMFQVSQAQAADVPQSFTLDGKLFSDAAGTTALQDSSITFTVQILDEAKLCVIYEESQLVSTAASKGYFSVQVGSEVGSLVRTAGDSGNTMSQVFQNISVINGKLLSNGAPCTVPPVAAKRRYVRIKVLPASLGGVARTLSPDLTIDSVPNAVIAERAETLQGLRAANVLQVNTGGTNQLSQANLESLFTSTTRFNSLTAVVDGTSSNYMRTNSASGAQLPVMAGAPTGPGPGSIWFDSSDSKLKYQTTGGPVSVGSGSGTVTSVDFSAPAELSVAGAPIVSSGTIAVTWATQTANKVFASPDGVTGTPAFRAMVASDVPNLPWSKITSGTPTTLLGYGITDAVRNISGTPSLESGLDAAKGAATTAGRVWISTDTKQIYRDNGATWDLIGSGAGGGGTVTSVSSANSYLSVTNGTTTPSLTLNVGTAVNTVAAGNDSRITGALQQATAFSGDVSGVYSATSVDKIKGTGVSIAALGTGNFLKYNGTDWVNASLGASDITTALTYTPVNKAGDTMTGLLVLSADPSVNLGSATKQYVDSATSTAQANAQTYADTKFITKNLPAAPTVAENGQSIRWNNGTSAWEYYSPGAGAGDFMKDGSVAMTGTLKMGGNAIYGNSTASGNLTLESTSDATKGHVILQPNGGNVGIGTTSPTAYLHLKAGTATAGTAPLKLTAGTNLSTAEAGAIEYDGTNLFYTTTGLQRRTLASFGTSGGSNFLPLSGGTLTGDLTVHATGSAANLYIRATSGSHDPMLHFDTGGGENQWSVGLDDTADDTNAKFTISQSNSVRTNPRLTILPGGNVGIGTTTPSDLLSVSKSQNTWTTISVSNASNGNSAAAAYTVSSDNGFLGSLAGYSSASATFPNLANRVGLLSSNSASGLVLGSYNNVGDIRFYIGDPLDANEKLRVASSGNVGIGTTTPASPLSVYRASSDADVLIKSGAGNSAGITLDRGTGFTYGYLDFKVGGTLEMSMGKPKLYDGVGVWAPGDDIRMLVQQTGVAIGDVTSDPSAALDVIETGTTMSAIIVPRAGNFTGTNVNGMIRYNTSSTLFEFRQNGAWVNYTTVSDGRLKINVVPVTDGLDIVNQLNPVFYDWDRSNPKASGFEDKHQVGFIAQDVEKVLPEVVNKGEDSYRSLEYGKIVSVVVAAVKELYAKVMGIAAHNADQDRQIATKADKTEVDAKIQNLESENDKLKQENVVMKARLDKIENMLKSK